MTETDSNLNTALLLFIQMRRKVSNGNVSDITLTITRSNFNRVYIYNRCEKPYKGFFLKNMALYYIFIFVGTFLYIFTVLHSNEKRNRLYSSARYIVRCMHCFAHNNIWFADYFCLIINVSHLRYWTYTSGNIIFMCINHQCSFIQ